MGITPACAGKRILQALGAGTWRDHPRLCGEKHLLYADWSRDLGSPPPVRGKDLRNRLSLYCTRITPACAGKRDRLQCRMFCVKDHPRLCGEKTKKIP